MLAAGNREDNVGNPFLFAGSAVRQRHRDGESGNRGRAADGVVGLSMVLATREVPGIQFPHWAWLTVWTLVGLLTEQALREVRPQLYLIRHTALCNGLCVCITNNKIDAFDTLTEHVVYCIAAPAPNTYYFNNR